MQSPVGAGRARSGRCLLLASAALLILSGVFALYLAIAGRFLPHDERFLGMTARELCALHGCRIVHFMVHDRVSFGGALIAIGALYAWLIQVPLRRGEAWPWWVLLLSGVEGFGSFFAYLGYGYLDTWHGLATLALLPCFALGVAWTCPHEGPRCLPRPAEWGPWRSAAGLGRLCLLGVAVGLVGAGLTILVIGTTCVFVPQDLSFMGVTVEELQALNPRLVPLIAHDRAGFGGGVCCCGLTVFFCVWSGRRTQGLLGTLAIAGLAGFGCAIGAHPGVGYTDPVHLTPAVLGACGYLVGLLLACKGRDALGGERAAPAIQPATISRITWPLTSVKRKSRPA
jgi:hypothetical protein